MGFTAIAAGVLAIGGEKIVHLFYLGKQTTHIKSTYIFLNNSKLKVTFGSKSEWIKAQKTRMRVISLRSAFRQNSDRKIYKTPNKLAK